MSTKEQFEQLDRTTVGSSNELIGRLAERIVQASGTGARPHTLVIGPYGSGKTHALKLAQHRALRSFQTTEQILLAWVDENTLGIGSYADLLVEIIRSTGISIIQERAVELRAEADTSGLERLFLDQCQGRMALLVVEQLDEIFKRIGVEGQSALRGLVESQKSILLFASARHLFPGVANRDYPWYGSFDVERVAELTELEAEELVKKLAPQFAPQKSKLAGFAARKIWIHHQMLGGSPRVWQLFAAELKGKTDLDFTWAFMRVVDRLTPYYTQRLQQLSPAEQRLLVELRPNKLKSTPYRVTDLAKAAGMSVSSAASLLGRLARSGWVRAQKDPNGDRRASWYTLADQALAAWIAMVYWNSRPHKTPAGLRAAAEDQH
ncbi:MAG: helix-turn-helix domain-containing protein [Segniliparus sp.]|uniref:MarR family winged helix-turn-helix transcriptional regulator n=1 Tax=Segniliparus sp. TaxID=2804064 RepID=UPI003F38AF04